MTIWRMRSAYGISKATDTHSDYVIRIAFQREQLLGERASILRYTYDARLCYHLTHGIKRPNLSHGERLSVICP